VDRARGETERHPNTLHDGDGFFELEELPRDEVKERRPSGVDGARSDEVVTGCERRRRGSCIRGRRGLEPASGLLPSTPNLFCTHVQQCMFSTSVKGGFRTRSMCRAIESSCRRSIDAEGRVEGRAGALEPVLAVTKVNVGDMIIVIVEAEVMQEVPRSESRW
jgi:hypothetical protein